MGPKFFWTSQFWSQNILDLPNYNPTPFEQTFKIFFYCGPTYWFLPPPLPLQIWWKTSSAFPCPASCELLACLFWPTVRVSVLGLELSRWCRIRFVEWGFVMMYEKAPSGNSCAVFCRVCGRIVSESSDLIRCFWKYVCLWKTSFVAIHHPYGAKTVYSWLYYNLLYFQNSVQLSTGILLSSIPVKRILILTIIFYSKPFPSYIRYPSL